MCLSNCQVVSACLHIEDKRNEKFLSIVFNSRNMKNETQFLAVYMIPTTLMVQIVHSFGWMSLCIYLLGH